MVMRAIKRRQAEKAFKRMYGDAIHRPKERLLLIQKVLNDCGPLNILQDEKEKLLAIIREGVTGRYPYTAIDTAFTMVHRMRRGVTVSEDLSTVLWSMLRYPDYAVRTSMERLGWEND